MCSAPRELVSIVTPSLNQARFLEETLRSVYLQKYRPIEHVVMDGGSSDGSVAILKRCAEEFRSPAYSLQWVSKPDRGFADALGKGFARTRGQIVGWLNSDDVYFDRHAIGTAVRELDEHPDVDVVYGDVALISENSGLWMIWCFPNFQYKRALRGYIVPQPTVFCRRIVVEENPLDPRIEIAVDHLYWLQIGQSHKFRHVGRVQAADRDHPMRQTHMKRSVWTAESSKLLQLYGRGYRPTALARSHDVLIRLLMRFNGLIRAAGIAFNSRLPNLLAFPMWTDSRWGVIRRQFTMRIGMGPDLGVRAAAVDWPPAGAPRQTNVDGRSLLHRDWGDGGRQ